MKRDEDDAAALTRLYREAVGGYIANADDKVEIELDLPPAALARLEAERERRGFATLGEVIDELVLKHLPPVEE